MVWLKIYQGTVLDLVDFAKNYFFFKCNNNMVVLYGIFVANYESEIRFKNKAAIQKLLRLNIDNNANP